jgi:Fe-S oxidoreductase
MHFSPAESAVVAALVIASLYLFWRRLERFRTNIRRARDEPGYKLEPYGPRVRKFFAEVVGQVLVIRQRPLPGLAHAFVFWGFCAFALVTANHLAAAFNVPFLGFEGFGRVYFWFAGAFAVAVIISIVGLTIRRYAVRPRWLEPITLESGVIAFLIFVLMATYLAQFRLAEDTTAGRLNWWAHTLALVIFLPIIPRTKHLHLALSPFTVFLERHGFSSIPPLVGDEDFGLDTGKDVTKVVTLQAYSCVECGRCSEHCPATNTGKILDPKKMALGTRAYLNEFGAGAEEPLLGKHLSMEAAFQCTTCGSCEFQCPVGIQHLPLIIGLRRGAVNTGKWEDDYGGKLFLNLERYGNTLGFPHSEREKFIQKNSLPLYDEQEYCLWMGCMGSYDPQGREILLAFVEVLRHLGISFGVLKTEKCNGDPVRRLGNDYLFGELAQANLDAIKAAGVTKMVSICPHCVRTIGTDWKEFGADIRIEHHSEFLARHSSQLPVRANGRQAVAYHDACYLGRYRGVYDEPRSVIERWGKLAEPERSRERGFCCGAGGGLAFLGEEKGKRVNRERAEQLIATGAEVVGAACPFCNTMLRDGLAAASPKPPQLLDIAQIAAASLKQNTHPPA